MKKCLILFLALLLCGCAAAPTFETLGHISHTNPTIPKLQKVVLSLPEDATKSVMSNDSDTVYHCQNYTIVLQTMASGDLSATVDAISGFSPHQLTMLQSRCADHDRYDWVWTAVGEGGDVVCRAAVLDDGAYHYSLQVFASAQEAGDLTEAWNALFQSFCLETQ